MPKITYETANQRCTYDPESGEFRSKKNGRRMGSIERRRNGAYRRINFGKRIGTVYEHRLAFLLMTRQLPKQVDHISKDGTENFWANLRECDHEKNQWNTKLYRNNKSGVTGVHREGKRWIAELRCRNQRFRRSCATFDEAVYWRRWAEQHYRVW
jgi:hypothetical protein